MFTGVNGWADLDDYFTLGVITHQDHVLMGYKTRGAFEGKLVFPGGKQWHRVARGVVQLSSPQVDTARGVEEETGLKIAARDLGQVGLMNIFTEEGDERTVTICKGEATNDRFHDSDELQNVAWRHIDRIPFDKTPEDYRFWVPSVLDGNLADVSIEVDNEGLIADGRVCLVDPTAQQRPLIYYL